MTKKSSNPKSAARKTASGSPSLPKAKLNALQKRLAEMRTDMLETVRKKQDREVVETETGDEADQATASIEKEIAFELNDNERLMLDEIEAALRRLEKGTFGTCEGCRKPIDAKRIQALPFVRYCIRCQSTHEHAVPA